MKVTLHQAVRGGAVGDQPEMSEKEAEWYVTNGYASVDDPELQKKWAPTGGRTAAPRDTDPTLAENREGPNDPAPGPAEGTTDTGRAMTHPAGGDYFMPPSDTAPNPEFRNAYDQRGRGQVFDNGEAPRFVDQRADRSDAQPRKAASAKPGDAAGEPKGSSAEGKGKRK